MPPKKITDPRQKDPDKSSRPASCTSSRLALRKVQTNETDPRLDTTNRPRANSNRSFKDVVLSTTPTSNRFQVLQATGSQTTTNSRSDSKGSQTQSVKASSVSSPKIDRTTLKIRSKSPEMNSGHSQKLSSSRESPILNSNDTRNYQQYQESENAQVESQEGKWITVTKSKRRSPSNRTNEDKGWHGTSDELKGNYPHKPSPRGDDAISMTSSTRQEIAEVKANVMEVKADVNDIRNDIKSLMNLFHTSNSIHHIRPTSVISVKESSRSVQSNEIESVTSRVVHTAPRVNQNEEYDEYDKDHIDEEQKPHPDCFIDEHDEYDKDHIDEDQVPHHDRCMETSSAIHRKIRVENSILPTNGRVKNECEDIKYIPSHIPKGYYNKDDQRLVEESEKKKFKQPKIEGASVRKSNRRGKSTRKARRSKYRDNRNQGMDSDSSDTISDTDGRPLFANNKFSLISNEGKIKFSNMISFLKEKKLEDDSPYEIKKMYDSIVRSIAFAFQTHIEIMPRFRQLESTTVFSDIFLENLVGSMFDKNKVIFDRIGEVIKDVLTSSTNINKSKSPKTHRIVETNKLADGWTILQEIIRGRIPFCGAEPDTDLDIELAHLTFKEGESIHQFYSRTQSLRNQYEMQYRHDYLIPTSKMVIRFIKELMRAQEYVPYIINQYRTIIEYKKCIATDQDHGQQLPYSVKDIYDVLDKAQVNEVPSSSLTPSTLRRHKNNISIVNSKKDNDDMEDSLRSVIASYKMDPQLEPIIAAFDSIEPSEECMTPNICAMSCPRKRCHACLLGFHEEINCYLRGQDFMPEELKQRINRYNATHGSSPPLNHKPPEYKPSSVAAEFVRRKHATGGLRGKSNTEGSDISKKKNVRFQKKVPFSNNKTKQVSMNSFETNIEEDTNDEVNIDQSQEQDNGAVISAFIADQKGDVEENGEFYYLNNTEDESVLCVVDNSYEQSKLANTREERHRLIENIDYSTPEDLLQVIGEFHKGNKNQPNRHFLLQHSIKLSKLPTDIYRKYDTRNFQVDSGANVSSVNDRALFYFYINNEVSAEIAGGGNVSSPGWGGILIQIGNGIHLISPVHYLPGSPRNILSTGALITFSGFKDVNHKMYKSLTMVNNFGKKIEWPLETRNYLNFRDITIMSFDHNMYDMKQSSPRLAPANSYEAPKIVRQSKMDRILQEINVNEVPELEPISVIDESSNIKPEIITLANGRRKEKDSLRMPTLSTTEISHIASFYINLYPSVSPRANAIATMNNLLGQLNTTLPDGLPIIFTTPPQSLNDEQNVMDDSIVQPIINSKLSRTVSRSTNNLQEYMHLHLSCMHASNSVLIPMLKNQLLKDLPDIEKDIHRYDCTCLYCVLTKSNKLRKGKLVDYLKMKPFQQLHLDFAIYNHTSIRGMTSALGIVCASTTYPFGFPTKNRNPPLEIVQYVIQSIRKMGFEVNFIRVDEDGALAKSAEFCRLIVKLNCVLQTTSGGNSENNGKVERAHRTQANMVRASLCAMEVLVRDELKQIPKIQVEDFWCFAYAHAIHTQRRIYSATMKDIPYFIVHKKRPSAKELVPFGSIITIINPSKDKLPKLARDRAIRGYFLGFGNHVRSLLYWDPKQPSGYKRTYHAVIEDTTTIARLQPDFISPAQNDNRQHNLQLFREFDLTTFPISKDKISRITIPTPTPGTPLGIRIMNDEVYNMPYISKVHKDSVVKEYIPVKLRRNQYVLHINGNSPIRAKFVVEHIKHLQETGVKEIHLDLVHRGIGNTTTSLEGSRAIFDQMPSLYMNKPVIASINSDIPQTHLHFVCSSSKPEKPRFFHECLKSPIRNNWIAAAKIAFEKNHRIAVFSLPFPKEQLPSDQRVFGTVLVPEVKQTDIPGVWELRIRECIIGTAQKKRLDYEESYSPTVNETTVKLQIAMCSALNYTVAIIDVKNAFQNTISKQEKRIFVTVPPTYLEWLAKYDRKFTFEKGKIYIRQMLNANQGTRDAGNQWYALLYSVLKEFGLVRATMDHGFFVQDYGQDGKLYVSLATDDLLCGFLKQEIFDQFVKFLQQYFTIVVQTGNVLKVLGIRVVQSDLAISIDQAQYIYDMCIDYFGKEPGNIRTVSIPMRSDAELEKELFNSPPLTKEELVQATLKYKGGYRHHIGKLNFAVITRFNIQFAVQRLAEYCCEPTLAAFEAIERIYRYLAQDILRPLVFPRNKLSDSASITITLTPEQEATLELSNQPSLFTDAELARDLATRQSYYCIVVTVLGVIIMCKIKKSSAVMIHTTDSEAQASYDGVRRIQPIRALCEFMGYPLEEPTAHYVDNSAVHQIITSERMTPRCRHFDLPIAFLHEQVNKSFKSNLIKTWLQLGDIGTKPLVRALHKRFKYWGSGARYLPPAGSEHYINLEMEYYEMKFSDIISMLQE